MTWFGSAPVNRPIDAGLAALFWTAASLFALRGLTLRPIVYNTTLVHPGSNLPGGQL